MKTPFCIVTAVSLSYSAWGQDARLYPGSSFPPAGADRWTIQNASATNIVVTSELIGSMVVGAGVSVQVWDDGGFYLNEFGSSPLVLSSGVDSSFAFAGVHAGGEYVLQIGGGGISGLSAVSWRCMDRPNLAWYVGVGFSFGALVCGFRWQLRIAKQVAVPNPEL